MNIFEQNAAPDSVAMYESCVRAVVQGTREMLQLEAEGKASGRTRLRVAWTVADYEDAARELSFEDNLPSAVKDDLWMAGRFVATIGKASRQKPGEREASAERLASAADSLEQSAREVLAAIAEEARFVRKGPRDTEAAPDREARPKRRLFGRKQ